MEGWHTTGTALLPLLRRVAPPFGSVNPIVSNLQYPSRWKVHLGANSYSVHEEPLSLQVIDVSQDVKQRYLGQRKYIDERTRSDALLQRLEEIDSKTSRYFKPKYEARAAFELRLLAPRENRQKPCDIKRNGEVYHQSSSYIALSYCWHYTTWKPNPDLCNVSPSSNSHLPITSPMWRAFLAERETSTEALWVDQGCIHQSDQDAKLNAINSMDIVFGGARKVVIALEDVLLSPQDAEALMQYCHAIQSLSGRERLLVWSDWLEFLEGKEELAVACLKIFRARWFRRAWCSQEFLTGKSHTFLVPVMREYSSKTQCDDPVTILDFNADFLLALLLARTDWILSKDRNDLASVILHHENTLGGKKVDPESAIDRFLSQNTIMVGFTQGLIEATLKRENSESRKPYLSALGDILSLQSSSAVDKLAITLNVLNTGLSYKGPSDLSETDVSLIATLVAFAAGDASALASNGASLDNRALKGFKRGPTSNDYPSESSSKVGQRQQANNSASNPIGWATRPHIDTYSRLGLERIESPVIASMTQKGLQLPLSFVATSDSVRLPEKAFEVLASKLLSWYPRQECGSKGPNGEASDQDTVLAEFRAFSLESDQVHQTLTSIDLPQIIQALACLLELGPWWLAGYGTHLRPDFLSNSIREADKKLSLIREALLWAQTMDSQTAPKDLGELGSDDSCLAHLTQLFRYASEVVRTGAGERSEFVKKQINPDFAFQICKMNDAVDGVVSEAETIIFAPRGTSTTYDLAIPLALTTQGFPIDMNRAWILERSTDDGSARESQSHSRNYILRGKTRFVGCPVPDGQVRQVVVSGGANV